MYRHPRRPVIYLLGAIALLAAIGAIPAAAQSSERCFPETGFCIAGPIRTFWEANGGLPVFGFPISPQQEEPIEGQPTQVQWFERTRLEVHPELAPPSTVLLGRLGADRLAQQGRDWFTFPKSDPQPGCRYFPETGHNLCGALLTAWRSHGLTSGGQRGEAASLALFGLPLSDAQAETIDGRDLTVQWFERARFELHPENAPPADVLFGLLGAEIQAGSAPVAVEDPCGDIPTPVSGQIRPGVCINQGEPISIDIFGFNEHEPISFWLTAPNGTIVSMDRISESNGSGGVADISFDTAGLFPGLWYWVFQGISSSHQAIIYVKVLGAAAPAPAPGPLNPTIAWGAPQRLTQGNIRSLFPWVAIDSNNKIHIIYSTIDGKLLYTNNVAGSYAAPQQIEENMGINGGPFFALAIGPGNILHVAYTLLGGDQQIYYRAATLDGAQANWSPRQQISDYPRAFTSHLVVDANNTAHIVWVDKRCGVYNVFYRAHYADGSLSGVNAPLGDCVAQNRPQVAVTAEGNLHITFEHDTDIYYARFDGGGWAVQNISESPGSRSYNPTITTDGTALYTAWEEGVNNHDILFRRSTDGGQHWSDIVVFSGTPAYASFPNAAYAASSQRVYIAWADATDSADGQPEIWFRTFDPGSGATSEPQRLTSMKGSSTLPIVATGPNSVAIVWQDKSSGEWQIFHIDGVLGG